MRATVVGGVALAGVTGLLTVLAAAPAAAHTQLLDSRPGDGAVLATAPETLTLSFTDRLIAEGSSLVAAGPTGAVPVTAVGVTDHDLTAQWPATAGTGTFQITYRVVSADGHPVTGAISFTVGGPSDPGGTLRADTGGVVVTVAAVVVAVAVVVALLWTRRRTASRPDRP
ncbi:MAG: copper resistance protein CopC [Actinomycetota bacterium]|nr:MAG: copper resistance protein CopC [Actinomycetota bacterium]